MVSENVLAFALFRIVKIRFFGDISVTEAHFFYDSCTIPIRHYASTARPSGAFEHPIGMILKANGAITEWKNKLIFSEE